MRYLWLLVLACSIGWLPAQVSAAEARIAYFRPGKILTTYALALEVSQIERQIILNEAGWPVTDADGQTRLVGCFLLTDQSEAAVLRRQQENQRLRQLLSVKQRERDQRIEVAVKAVAARNSLSVVLNRPALILARSGDITPEILRELEQGTVQLNKVDTAKERASIGVLDMKLLSATYTEMQGISPLPDLSLEIARLSQQLELAMVLDKRIVYLGGLDLTPMLLPKRDS